MDDEKYQKELFQFEKPKRLFPRLAKILPKADFEGRVLITFTLERIVFISIGILMIMVLTYALGVERGRRFSGAAVSIPNKPLEQKMAGCVIGSDYPAPIVDHAAAREATLARFKVVKGAGEALEG